MESSSHVRPWGMLLSVLRLLPPAPDPFWARVCVCVCRLCWRLSVTDPSSSPSVCVLTLAKALLHYTPVIIIMAIFLAVGLGVYLSPHKGL